MADLTAMLQAAAGAAVGDYQISRSLRFNSADSAYLSRTPASASNRKTWTWSFWIKLAKIDASSENWFAARTGSGGSYTLFYRTSDKIAFLDNQGASLQTTALYRDPSAWYHIVLACDTTQATASNRLKLYVNGTQVTAFSTETYPSQNADLNVNTTDTFLIGQNDSTLHPNVYMTEINFIDGSALTPSSFGETNETTGVWSPIAYAGSYGTNGFYLNFSDNTSTTTLGEDQAGSNDWTLNNFSVTAGAGNDSLVDTPTQYGTDTGAGGEVRGNYCTLNPLTKGAYLTLSNGNLQTAGNSVTDSTDARSTFAFSTGKWYWEFTPTTINSIYPFNGIIQSKNATSPNTGTTNQVGVAGDSCAYLASGDTRTSNSTAAYGNSYTANDVIGVAVDADNGALYFSKNGTFQNSGVPTSGASKTGAAFTWTGSTPEFVAAVSEYNTSASNINFGQRPFAYTAPSGFKALVTTNLPEPTVVQGDDYFNTVLYTGTGSSLGVTGVGFQPDWVWIKERNGVADFGVYDAVRGVTKQLESNTTTAETTEATGLTAFGTDGFTVGALAQLNTSADTYVAWNWKANGAGVSNTDGTISSTVSVNTTSGFSIVRWDGNGAGVAATIGHGLSAVPKMIINKGLDFASAWSVYHASAGNTVRLTLNTTDAVDTNAGWWNNTTPTSTVFTVGSIINQATPYDYVAYCFAEVEGFSKFGSYTGNGSTDGVFVYTGFRPAFVLYKDTNATNNWEMIDATRNPHNVANGRLFPSASSAESTSENTMDLLSNGFKFRDTYGGGNASGINYIYMAFAENPFKNSLAR
jgi:hypothetical protein